MQTEFAYDEHMMEEDKEDLAETSMADEAEESEDEGLDENGDEIKKKEEVEGEDEEV